MARAIAVACLVFAVAGGVIDGALALFDDTASVAGNTFVTDTLAPPTGVSATPGATITIDWTATTDTYATGHRVLRGTAPGGPYSQIAEITPRTTVTYIDSPAAGTYYYVVRAYKLTNWESVNSSEVSAATP